MFIDVWFYLACKCLIFNSFVGYDLKKIRIRQENNKNILLKSDQFFKHLSCLNLFSKGFYSGSVVYDQEWLC